MDKTLKLTVMAAAAIALTASCGKMGELSADNFKVTPTPLEAKAGTVEATINGTFPEKYMKKKAVVKVTPVLKYTNSETASASQTFQGEKVLGNDQTISYRLGGNYTMRAKWDYTPDMLSSDLYLRFNAKVGKKTYNVPEVKVGYGVLATSDLLRQALATANASVAPDDYQRIIEQKQEANIKFLIGQAQLRQSELKSTSVQDFIQMLRDINANKERLALDGIEVSAYASPDGAFELNEKLAANRQNVSSEFLRKQMSTDGIEADVDTKYTAEDWDGFQQLVAASNIQDKEIILRVLSMYEDPEERERQIHNMSSVFTELADGILPELRRARLTINYEVIGRDDDEILAQYKKNPSQLSLEELIYGATMLVDTDAERTAWNKAIITRFPNDYRAYNNLAAVAYNKGDLGAMKEYTDKAATLNPSAPEINVNRALMALAQGNAQVAESYLGRGAGADAYNETLGNLCIAKGNYSQAEIAFGGIYSNSAALAQILNKNYSAAAKTLAHMRNSNATTDYLSAILSARTGDMGGVVENLRKAIAKDSNYAQRALNDMEFAPYAGTVKSMFK